MRCSWRVSNVPTRLSSCLIWPAVRLILPRTASSRSQARIASNGWSLFERRRSQNSLSMPTNDGSPSSINSSFPGDSDTGPCSGSLGPVTGGLLIRKSPVNTLIVQGYFWRVAFVLRSGRFGGRAPRRGQAAFDPVSCPPGGAGTGAAPPAVEGRPSAQGTPPAHARRRQAGGRGGTAHPMPEEPDGRQRGPAGRKG